jgi:cytidine deaminase
MSQHMAEIIMNEITNTELIERAKSVVQPHKVQGNFMVGDVGSALLSENGNVYLGVCIDTSSGMGFCAEHSAIAAMVTAGELRIRRIVAVLQDSTILPPCGRCREFMFQIDAHNLETEVILGKDKSVRLKELLPYHG